MAGEQKTWRSCYDGRNYCAVADIKCRPSRNFYSLSSHLIGSKVWIHFLALLDDKLCPKPGLEFPGFQTATELCLAVISTATLQYGFVSVTMKSPDFILNENEEETLSSRKREWVYPIIRQTRISGSLGSLWANAVWRPLRGILQASSSFYVFCHHGGATTTIHNKWSRWRSTALDHSVIKWISE